MNIPQILERVSGLPFADRVRLNLWSRYGTMARFAEEAGISYERLRQLMKTHRWDLMPPPAVEFQNQTVPSNGIVGVREGETRHTTAFVPEVGAAARPTTIAAIKGDRHALEIHMTCREPHCEGLTVSVQRGGGADPLQQAFWDGDVMALKRIGFRERGGEWVRNWRANLPPLQRSVLLDDCVVIFITPVSIGKDRSHLFATSSSYVPDPPGLRAQLPPFRDSRIYLEGAFYFLAVNPAGALLDVFYDPYGGGTFCPAWSSEAKVEACVGRQQWDVHVRIPWKSLKPVVNEDSVWGVDLCRIRRCGLPKGVVTRSRETTFIQYDIPIRTQVPIPRLVPEITIKPLRKDVKPGDFPARSCSSGGGVIRGFFEDRSGRPARGVEAMLTYDARRLFIRFECHERDMSRLVVVTREEEEREYGVGHRKCNYIDRRENFGIDWGDYVEVLLAPNLDFADRFHGGLFQFLVNSRGDVLERYYDEYGAFSVPPQPEWKSGADVRVRKAKNHWTVELALPFSALCTDGMAGERWGLNLHRCRSSRVVRGEEQHILWSPTYNYPRHPNWMHHRNIHKLRDPERLGILRIDPQGIRLRGQGKAPGPALARPQGTRDTPPKRDHSADTLTDVCFPDPKHGWAAGGRGTILHTKDGGNTWREQQSGTGFLLERVFFLDEGRGWIVGGWPRDPRVAILNGMGIILATADGGKHWRPQWQGEGLWLCDVFFVDGRHGWAVGERGTVLRTTNGGRRWRHVRQAPTRSWLYGVHFTDTCRGWAVGHDETILRTQDGGETWAVQAAPASDRPFGWPIACRKIVFANGQDGWIVGDHGNILSTRDGGRIWRMDHIVAEANLRDLLSFTDVTIGSDGTVWAVSPMALARKRRGDRAWRLVGVGGQGWIKSVAFPVAAKGIAVGGLGTILRTGDDGRTWQAVRKSSRRPGVLYASAHDHHINGAPMAMLSEELDSAYVNCGRGIRCFEQGGDVNPKMVTAAALARGVTFVHSSTEFSFRESRTAHGIAQRYQVYGGIEAIEKRLVALIRTVRPDVLIAEQPILQEGYYAHGVGEVARALLGAFESAADPARFPELLGVGLDPWAPKKAYIISLLENEVYGIHAPTLRVSSEDRFSPRLGMTYDEAAREGRYLFWGLLDRGEPPKKGGHGWRGAWNLHLKRSRVTVPNPEQSIFNGI